LVDVKLVVFEEVGDDCGYVGQSAAVTWVADEVEDGDFWVETVMVPVAVLMAVVGLFVVVLEVINPRCTARMFAGLTGRW
jgi:hypothetical protein